MNLPHHRLSPESFAGLATGDGGSGAVRELAAAEYSKHAILLRGVLAAAQGSDQYQLARTGYDLLATAWRADRAAAERVIRYPSVGVWARRTIWACRSGSALPGAEPGGLRAVAAVAAIRAGLQAEIEVAVTDGRVVLPSLGAAMVPGCAAVVRSGGGHAQVGPVEIPEYPHQDAPGWLGLRQIRAGSLDVLIDDLDPFRMPGAPDLAPRATPGPWADVLGEALVVLEQNQPGVAAEIAAAVSVIVPCFQPSQGVASATSQEAFGAIAMSQPPSPVAGAETLIHEVQHVKLGALLDIVTLTLPDDGRRYYAPWRDDPRPLNGLFQGTYAFLGVTEFWRRQRQLTDGHRRADIIFARWRTAVAQAVETLRASERLTSAGLDFVSGMARTLASWQDESVPLQAQAEARHAAESHLARWQFANGTGSGMLT
jgi:uncharacterized protein